MTTIDAAMPHMHLTLVSGSFGKGNLCPDKRAGQAEQTRRANRLRECVEYVTWQAWRVAPGKVLVITYQAIEEAFAKIAGVMTGHFNAIAGLGLWGDVTCLIIIGRPFPASHDLNPLSGAFFGHEPEGRYRKDLRAVLIREGSRREVSAMAHEDEKAEILRAAICDYELIQAVGRGRGVNRTADKPLEVHVLADVAVPLVHDAVVLWDNVKHEIFQRMLLAGLAVDSPADAVALHPELFASPEQAKKALQRAFLGDKPL